MTPEKVVFTGEEGEILLAADAKKIKDAHQSRKREIIKGGKDNYVEAEFFGLKTFKRLIENFQDDAVGFRVYYGNRNENHDREEMKMNDEVNGKRTSRVIIVPVDKFGNDLRPPVGLKDGSGYALGNGPLCPNNCAPPPAEN
jgi:hypothetical protein